MKKSAFVRTLSVLLAALLLSASLTACTEGGTGTETDTEAPATEGETAAEAPATDAPTEAPATDAPTEAPTEAETEPPVTDLFAVKDGKSFPIVCEAETGSAAWYAARVLQADIQKATGVKPSLLTAPIEGECFIVEGMTATEDTGDCGYTVKVNGSAVHIAAPSLAGFDNACTAMVGGFSDANGMAIPLDYAAAVRIDSGANYTIDAADFKPANTAAPFYNDKNDSAAYICNTMWHMFGAIDDGQGLVYRFGNEPTWYEWMSEKIMWSGDSGYINELKGKIQNFPQTSIGYMWAWSSYPYWKVDDCYSIHYDGTFRIIAAAYDVVSWENSTAFLFAKDGTNAGGQYGELDASKGRTVLEKVETAWDYILYQLHGETGIVQLTEESTYLNEDGSLRFDFVKDTGEFCWNNTGLPNSHSSNYWDNLCFGNYDAYENALFYEACQAMIGIYGMLGGDYLQNIPYLTNLLGKIHDNYDKYFWNDETGRYIGTIDTDNNKVDYGFTFVNFEALKYGLGDAEKAKSVFDWVDGDRIVEGDTRTGAEIMSYFTMMRKTSQSRKISAFDQNLVLAPAVNTLAINNKDNKKSGVIWWHGPAGINPWAGAAYGAHCENGGYIFYTVFYELMARTQYEGAQSTTDRLKQIARVYEFNRLVSDEAAGGAAWLEGLIGEFPESGLVPTVYISSLMGISAEADGLHVAPAFNSIYETMGVTSTTYGGNAYNIEENRNGTLTVTCLSGKIDMTIHYTPAHFDTFKVTLYKTDGTSAESTATLSESGEIVVSFTESDVEKLVIEAVVEIEVVAE